MSSMEATIKFEVAGKYNAYKDLKVASTLICQVEIMIDSINKLYVMFDKRIKKLGKKEGFFVINLAKEMKDYAEKNKIFLHLVLESYYFLTD